MSASLGANSARQAALLIDADNFSDPQAIDAAWAELNAYAGRVSVCRAYGAGPRLEWLQSVWRYLGTRTFPNLPLQKNTTDAALIADAVALHFQQGIRLFAIASGDADFAPLAVRLREWGCEVWCFSMEGIVFRDAEAYYDRVKCFPAPVFAAAPVTPAPLRPVVPSARGSSADAGAATAAPPAYRAPAAPLSTPLVSDAGLPDEVERILNAVPGLRERPQHLCHVVPVLQRHGFFDKRITRSTVFLARYAAYFELSPAHKPTLLIFQQPSAPPTPTPTPTPTPKCVPLPAQDLLSVCFPVHQPRLIQTVIKRREVHALRAVLAAVAQLKVSVADILLAVPELLQCQPCALSIVSARLRQTGLIRPSASGLWLLQRYPQSFRIRKGSPADAVQYLG
ncbi:NYN domain-containing protein [Polaromonas hydrogenivorans]|uniref:NYN domain-containing protein n=1 Tax=Polaromonas hydrogenivorans TaxID=335476 RepID=A0AAU7LTM7_9BURK